MQKGFIKAVFIVLVIILVAGVVFFAGSRTDEKGQETEENITPDVVADVVSNPASVNGSIEKEIISSTPVAITGESSSYISNCVDGDCESYIYLYGTYDAIGEVGTTWFELKFTDVSNEDAVLEYSTDPVVQKSFSGRTEQKLTLVPGTLGYEAGSAVVLYRFAVKTKHGISYGEFNPVYYSRE